MTRLSRLTRRQWLIVIHDLLATAAALICTLFIRFEDAQLAERLRWTAGAAGRLRGVCRRGLFSVRPARGEVALHLDAGDAAHHPRQRRCSRSRCWFSTTSCSRPIFTARSSSARSRSRFYFVIQILFLSAPRIAYRYFREGRTQRRSPRGQRRSDADPRARGGCRGAAARDRERRDLEHLAGGPVVAGALRSGRQRSRRAGAGRLRRSRTG